MKKQSLINFLNKYFEQVGNRNIIDEYSIDHDIKITVHDITKNNLGMIKFYIDSDPQELEHSIEDDDFNPVSFPQAVYEEFKTALDLCGITLSGNYFLFNKRSIDRDLPYAQDEISETIKIRTFLETVEDSELKWHTDNEDRLIKPTHKTNWMVQLDNELPQKLSENHEILIPKGVYHRLIKGVGDLKIKVKFV
jgi:hypothetical protein